VKGDNPLFIDPVVTHDRLGADIPAAARQKDEKRLDSRCIDRIVRMDAGVGAFIAAQEFSGPPPPGRKTKNAWIAVVLTESFGWTRE
jgi:hypothetical protein